MKLHHFEKPDRFEYLLQHSHLISIPTWKVAKKPHYSTLCSAIRVWNLSEFYLVGRLSHMQNHKRCSMNSLKRVSRTEKLIIFKWTSNAGVKLIQNGKFNLKVLKVSCIQKLYSINIEWNLFQVDANKVRIQFLYRWKTLVMIFRDFRKYAKLGKSCGSTFDEPIMK